MSLKWVWVLLLLLTHLSLVPLLPLEPLKSKLIPVLLPEDPPNGPLLTKLVKVMPSSKTILSKLPTILLLLLTFQLHKELLDNGDKLEFLLEKELKVVWLNHSLNPSLLVLLALNSTSVLLKN